MNERTLFIRFAQHCSSANIRSCWKQASKQTHYTVQCLSNRRQTTRVRCLLDRVQQMMILVHYIPRQRSCRRSPPQRIIKPNWSANPFNDETQLYSQSYWADDCVLVSYSSRSTSSALGRHHETVGTAIKNRAFTVHDIRCCHLEQSANTAQTDVVHPDIRADAQNFLHRPGNVFENCLNCALQMYWLLQLLLLLLLLLYYYFTSFKVHFISQHVSAMKLRT